MRDLLILGLWAWDSEVSLARDLLALLVHSCECLAFFRRRAFAVHHVVLPLALRTAHQLSYGSTPRDSRTHPPRKQCRRGRLPCLCPAWNPGQNHRHTSCHPASFACRFPACELHARLKSQAHSRVKLCSVRARVCACVRTRSCRTRTLAFRLSLPAPPPASDALTSCPLSNRLHISFHLAPQAKKQKSLQRKRPDAWSSCMTRQGSSCLCGMCDSNMRSICVSAGLSRACRARNTQKLCP